MNLNKGNLFVISGPSGTGKGTVCERLIENGSLFLSVSSTTRDKRAGEVDGVTYNYTTREAFKAMIEKGEMLEWAMYNDNYYGTPRSAVEKSLDEGKNVILEIEPQGAFKVKELFCDAVLIFIAPPSIEELKDRLLNRGRESSEQIDERIKAALWELSVSAGYNYFVVNERLDECVNSIIAIIEETANSRQKALELIKEAEAMGYKN